MWHGIMDKNNLSYFATLCHTRGYGWILQGDVDDFTMPEWKKQILDFLKENQTVSPMQLMEKYSISHNAARTNLSRLAKEGLIVKTGYGTYGLPEA